MDGRKEGYKEEKIKKKEGRKNEGKKEVQKEKEEGDKLQIERERLTDRERERASQLRQSEGGCSSRGGRRLVITTAPSVCWEAEITSDFEIRGSNTVSVAIVTGRVCVHVFECVCVCTLLRRFIMHDPHCDWS